MHFNVIYILANKVLSSCKTLNLQEEKLEEHQEGNSHQYSISSLPIDQNQSHLHSSVSVLSTENLQSEPKHCYKRKGVKYGSEKATH